MNSGGCNNNSSVGDDDDYNKTLYKCIYYCIFYNNIYINKCNYYITSNIMLVLLHWHWRF